MIFSQKESIYMRLAIAAPQMVSFCVQINGCEILCIIFLAPTDIFSVSLKRRTNNRTALFPKCYIHNVSYIYTLLFSSKIYNFLLHRRTVYNATKMWAVGIKQTRMHRFGGGGGQSYLPFVTLFLALLILRDPGRGKYNSVFRSTVSAVSVRRSIDRQ